jgi:hypothetical protein
MVLPVRSPASIETNEYLSLRFVPDRPILTLGDARSGLGRATVDLYNGYVVLGTVLRTIGSGIESLYCIWEWIDEFGHVQYF